MTEIVLVRHGQAAAGWDSDPDPGLDRTGLAQAEQLADQLQCLGPLPILTSPMLRCQQTAAPLAQRWSALPVRQPVVTEIPSPPGVELHQRGAWLATIMAGRWSDTEPATIAWRDALVRFVSELHEPSVVFTHFVAINVLVGHALSDDRVLVARIDHCAPTRIEVSNGSLTLIELGGEADTNVL